MSHRSLWVIVGLAFALRSAYADPAEDAYREGRKLYDLQEWDQAIEKFKVAYKLRSDGASLFNIAQAYRLKGDCPQASRFYKTYKRNFPDAPNIEKVDKLLADLEPCATSTAPPPPIVKSTKPPTPEDQALATGATTKPPVDATKPPVDATTQPDPTKPPARSTEPRPREPIVHRPRIFTWVVLGMSGVTLGTGAYFGYRAKRDFDNYQKTTDQVRYFELRDSVVRKQKIANVSFIIAGGLGLAAGVLFVIEGRSSRTVHVALDPTSNGFVTWGHF